MARSILKKGGAGITGGINQNAEPIRCQELLDANGMYSGTRRSESPMPLADVAWIRMNHTHFSKLACRRTTLAAVRVNMAI